MTQWLVERPIGICGVEARIEKAGCQKLGGGGMSGNVVFLLGSFVPDITRGRTEIDAIISADAIWRDDVLFEIFVLIVAPNQHEIRLEVIDCGTLTAKPLQQVGSMACRGGGG